VFLRARRAATEADARPGSDQGTVGGRRVGDRGDVPAECDFGAMRSSRYLTAKGASDYAGLLRLVTGKNKFGGGEPSLDFAPPFVSHYGLSHRQAP
jgi:hypothetical protein